MLYNVVFFWFVFLAALGLCCCMQAPSSCGEQGPLFAAVRGPLIVVASPVAEHGFQVRRPQRLWLAGSRAQAQQLWHTGLVALQHVGSFRTTAQTCVPCIGRQIPNHCTTMEVHVIQFSIKIF